MIDVIIPVWNLATRGLERVYYSVYSLQQDCEITVVNGSGKGEFKQLDDLIGNLCKHIHYPIDDLNLPILHNHGILESKCEYILRTDADYLFRKDFIETIKGRIGENKFLLKQVYKLGKMNITIPRIKAWKFQKGLIWEKEGDGACQVATKKWFLENPYDESMRLYGVMDNDMHYRANLKGMEVEWIEESEILHMWHKVDWRDNTEKAEQFEKNIIKSCETIKKLQNDVNKICNQKPS